MNAIVRLLAVLSTSISFRAGAADAPLPPGFAELLKIDVHSHVFEDAPEFHALFRELNIRTINVCNNGTDGHLEHMHALALDLSRAHPGLYPFEATFDLIRRDEPGYATNVIAWLDDAFRDGAVGVKIWKEIGLEIKDPGGAFILPDDARFTPIYAFIAQRGKVLHAHLAEPIDAWLPLDPDSNHYHYYSNNPEWHLYGRSEYPSHAELIAARDRILERHPDLVVLGAHLGSLEHDLDGLAERLERYPNFHIEVSARTRNLTRHPPEKVRALFLKYPDRILYGVDASWKPYLRGGTTEILRRAHLTRLRARYLADFDYYAGSGEIEYNGRRVQALALPPEVLAKFYHANAQRLFQLEDAP